MSSHMRSFEIVGLGCVAVDDVIEVPVFPAADEKVESIRQGRVCGGLTGRALLAAAQLGARCAYSAILGFDESSQFVLEEMKRHGINTNFVERQKKAGPIRSTVIVGRQEGTRNSFFDLSSWQRMPAAHVPREIISASKVLLVDDYIGAAAALHAAQIARATDVPVVVDIEDASSHDSEELLAAASHIIVSRRFVQTLRGIENPVMAVENLLSAEHEAVVVTDGEHGCWFWDGRSVVHQPAYRVRAVDTTGCGDVFHGAYAFGLARGFSLEKRIRVAAAVAALSATEAFNRLALPTMEDVAAFGREGEIA